MSALAAVLSSVLVSSVLVVITISWAPPVDDVASSACDENSLIQSFTVVSKQRNVVPSPVPEGPDKEQRIHQAIKKASRTKRLVGTDLTSGKALMANALHSSKPGETKQEVTYEEDEEREFAGEFPRVKHHTAAKILSVSANGLHDLTYFAESALIYGSLLLITVLAFDYLKRAYPLVYTYNTQTNDEAKLEIMNQVPLKWMPLQGGNTQHWIRLSLNLDLEDSELEKCIGLDRVLLLQFLEFAFCLLLKVGVPMILVMCPLSILFGGHAVGADFLAMTDMSALPDGSHIFWVHGVGVWYVVWMVQRTMDFKQENVLRKRFQWLNNLPPPQSHTVLVQNIPPEYSTEKSFTEMLEQRVFRFITNESVVEEVTFVKATDELRSLTSRLEVARQALSDAKHNLEEQAKMRLTRFMASPEKDEHTLNQTNDLEPLMEHVDDLEGQVALEKRKVESLDSSSGSAFVTFKRRRYAELFMMFKLTASDSDFVKSLPPEPVDVIWENALSDPASVAPKVIGYFLLLCLFILYTPIVSGISALTKLSYVQGRVPFVREIIQHAPVFASMWNALFASFGLTVFMALLPSIIMGIFKTFFPTVSPLDTQLGLHKWYFAFQLIFVVFVTAMSGSLASSASSAASVTKSSGTDLISSNTVLNNALYILRSPLSILDMFADTLPKFTHFYLNWYVLQWFTQALGLLRMANLFKYISFRVGLEFVSEGRKDIRAKELSEPENQESYGIGARSAETVLLLVVSLVYINLTPVICIPALITLGSARLIYGYLVVYSETHKPDSGGKFWHEQLQQVHTAMVLYILVMIGVLSVQSRNIYLKVLVAASLPYQLYCYYSFQNAFRDSILPVLNMSDHTHVVEHIRDQLHRAYVQPELQIHKASEQ